MPRRKKEEEALLSDKDRVPRGAANARERTRMRVLSKAFGRLKLTLPWVPPDTKLSKLDTLRLATSYISHLQKILAEEGSDSPNEEDNAIAKANSDHGQGEHAFVGGQDDASSLRLHCWPYGHHRLSPISTTSLSSTTKSKIKSGVRDDRHNNDNGFVDCRGSGNQQQLNFFEHTATFLEHHHGNQSTVHNDFYVNDIKNEPGFGTFQQHTSSS